MSNMWVSSLYAANTIRRRVVNIESVFSMCDNYTPASMTLSSDVLISLWSRCEDSKTVFLHRERDRLETKYREQRDALTTRGDDLDTENRHLRSLKYELDSKVTA